MKNRMLVSSLLFLASLAPLALQARAEENRVVTEAQQAKMELPGGIQATISPQSNLEWLGVRDNVMQVRLHHGTAQFQVPMGSTLKIEASSLTCLASDSVVQVQLTPAQVNIQCLRGELTVAGPGSELRRVAAGQQVDGGVQAKADIPSPSPYVLRTPPAAEVPMQQQPGPQPQTSTSGIEQAIFSALPSVLPVILTQGSNVPLGVPTGGGMPGLNLPSILSNLPWLIR